MKDFPTCNRELKAAIIGYKSRARYLVDHSASLRDSKHDSHHTSSCERFLKGVYPDTEALRSTIACSRGRKTKWLMLPRAPRT